MVQTNIFNGIYRNGALTYNTSDIEDQLEAIAVSAANMETINAAGGVKCWSIPSPIGEELDTMYHYSGSPIIFKASCIFFAVGEWSTIPTGAVTFDITVDGTAYQAYVSPDSMGAVTLDLFREGETSPAVTLEADEIKGVATFDVSSIVESWYEPLPQYTPYAYIWEATDVSLRFRVFGIEDSAAYTEFLCLRGVNDFGGDNEGYGVTDPILTKTRKFVSVPNATPLVTVIFDEDMEYSNPPGFYFTFQKDHVYHIQPQLWSWLNTELEPNEELELLDIKCESPFQVQWTNQKGGMEWFVFTWRQVYNRTAKTGAAKMLYNDYTRTDQTISEPYGLEHGKSVVCGVEQLTAEEYELLQTLPVSPYIVHSFGYQRLMRIAVKNYDGKQDTISQMCNMEIEFEIPTIVLEF